MIVVLIANSIQPGIEIRHLIEYQDIAPIGYLFENLAVKRFVGKEINIVCKSLVSINIC